MIGTYVCMCVKKNDVCIGCLDIWMCLSCISPHKHTHTPVKWSSHTMRSGSSSTTASFFSFTRLGCTWANIRRTTRFRFTRVVFSCLQRCTIDGKTPAPIHTHEHCHTHIQRDRHTHRDKDSDKDTEIEEHRLTQICKSDFELVVQQNIW